MTPDMEELIKRINTLTLDKNRLKLRLKHMSQGTSSPGSQSIDVSLATQGSNQLSPGQNVQCLDADKDKQIPADPTSSLNNNHNRNSSTKNTKVEAPVNSDGSNIISGVACSTSCEEDLLFLNDLYRKRLDEYDEKWDYMQSKCLALLSELTALQNRYAILAKEKLQLEESLRNKCDDYDAVKSELQTVVLNYETQLSAMSEHLSTITNQVSLADKMS